MEIVGRFYMPNLSFLFVSFPNLALDHGYHYPIMETNVWVKLTSPSSAITNPSVLSPF
jgi:hypothetical protein